MINLKINDNKVIQEKFENWITINNEEEDSSYYTIGEIYVDVDNENINNLIEINFELVSNNLHIKIKGNNLKHVNEKKSFYDIKNEKILEENIGDFIFEPIRSRVTIYLRNEVKNLVIDNEIIGLDLLIYTIFNLSIVQVNNKNNNTIISCEKENIEKLTVNTNDNAIIMANRSIMSNLIAIKNNKGENFFKNVGYSYHKDDFVLEESSSRENKIELYNHFINCSIFYIKNKLIDNNIVILQNYSKLNIIYDKINNEYNISGKDNIKLSDVPSKNGIFFFKKIKEINSFGIKENLLYFDTIESICIIECETNKIQFHAITNIKLIEIKIKSLCFNYVENIEIETYEINNNCYIDNVIGWTKKFKIMGNFNNKPIEIENLKMYCKDVYIENALIKKCYTLNDIRKEIKITYVNNFFKNKSFKISENEIQKENIKLINPSINIKKIENTTEKDIFLKVEEDNIWYLQVEDFFPQYKENPFQLFFKNIKNNQLLINSNNGILLNLFLDTVKIYDNEEKEISTDRANLYDIQEKKLLNIAMNKDVRFNEIEKMLRNEKHILLANRYGYVCDAIEFSSKNKQKKWWQKFNIIDFLWKYTYRFGYSNMPNIIFSVLSLAIAGCLYLNYHHFSISFDNKGIFTYLINGLIPTFKIDDYIGQDNMLALKIGQVLGNITMVGNLLGFGVTIKRRYSRNSS
jgi:hypothetical protein